MRAPEVLDHRADLLARLNDPTVRAVWATQVANDAMEASREQAHRAGDNTWDEGSTMAQEEAKSNGAANINALRNAMGEAEAFHVSPDLTTLVAYAASQLCEVDRIDRALAPTRSGLARFEGGLPFTDVRGKNLRISWIGWGPVLAQFRSRHDAGEPWEITATWMWNDHREEPDDVARDIIEMFSPEDVAKVDRSMGRWGFIGAGVLIDNARLGPAWVTPDETKAEEVIAEGGVPQEFTNVMRLIHAFFLLLGQTVTSSRTEVPDRARRRRAEKAKLPARVTVVSLRNTETTHAPGESLVEWSHRWVVRGFWRWQVCGPDHDIAQELAPGKWRARMWIAPYVKGPAGKPLIISEKVYAVHR
ncbi:MAG: hypothetical protein LC749_12340 [Actinobacteria bacterium]|nr:hypothetical protein [Actinomycetota bacterium]